MLHIDFFVCKAIKSYIYTLYCIQASGYSGLYQSSFLAAVGLISINQSIFNNMALYILLNTCTYMYTALNTSFLYIGDNKPRKVYHHKYLVIMN